MSYRKSLKSQITASALCQPFFTPAGFGTYSKINSDHLSVTLCAKIKLTVQKSQDHRLEGTLKTIDVQAPPVDRVVNLKNRLSRALSNLALNASSKITIQ